MTRPLESYILLASNWNLHFKIRSLCCDGTFVLMSTEYTTQGDGSPCTAVTIPLFTESRSGIAIRLKILLRIRNQGQNHNTSICVMIPLFTWSKSVSGIAEKLEIRLQIRIQSRNLNTSMIIALPDVRSSVRWSRWERVSPATNEPAIFMLFFPIAVPGKTPSCASKCTYTPTVTDRTGGQGRFALHFQETKTLYG